LLKMCSVEQSDLLVQSHVPAALSTTSLHYRHKAVIDCGGVRRIWPIRGKTSEVLVFCNTTSSCLTAYWCSYKHGGLFMCKGPTESFVIGRKLSSDCRDIAADVEESALKLQGELACLPLCMLLARSSLVQAICYSR
jgi:hypothetical protein